MKPKHATFKHLTLEDRCTILSGINQGDTFRAMAKAISKAPSTVAKEIRLHRTLVSRCQLSLACAAYRRCQRGRTCSLSCSDYRPSHSGCL
ncbi:helix-turn-helix domain-containing protein [Oscillospiraceae bacterium HV4-5-C5C]|nr:helix-turn-helix domain-containing protein [Oscillospiraceae bacterium HV4-5-C5C]